MAFIRHPKDFYAGLLFIAFGVAAIVIGSNYALGTAARMGPGYFPRILGILLVTLGAILVRACDCGCKGLQCRPSNGGRRWSYWAASCCSGSLSPRSGCCFRPSS